LLKIPRYGDWFPPKIVPERAHLDAEVVLKAFRSKYPRINLNHLKAQISALLAHYYQDVKNDQINTLIATHWIAVLQEFPQDCVDKAVMHWLKTEKRKPKPSEIRGLAIHYFGYSEWQKIEKIKAIYSAKIGVVKNDKKTDAGVSKKEREKVAQKFKEFVKKFERKENDKY